MRTLICSVALLGMSGGAAFATDACTRTGAEQYIRDSESAWAESVASKDASVIERILADDFIGVTPKGAPYAKLQMVQWTAQGGPYVSNTVGDITVRFFSDTLALAQGSETWAKSDGTTGRFVWLDTWLCRDGKWQIIGAEDLIAPVPVH